MYIYTHIFIIFLSICLNVQATIKLHTCALVHACYIHTTRHKHNLSYIQNTHYCIYVYTVMYIHIYT